MSAIQCEFPVLILGNFILHNLLYLLELPVLFAVYLVSGPNQAFPGRGSFYWFGLRCGLVRRTGSEAGLHEFKSRLSYLMGVPLKESTPPLCAKIATTQGGCEDKTERPAFLACSGLKGFPRMLDLQCKHWEGPGKTRKCRSPKGETSHFR